MIHFAQPVENSVETSPLAGDSLGTEPRNQWKRCERSDIGGHRSTGLWDGCTAIDLGRIPLVHTVHGRYDDDGKRHLLSKNAHTTCPENVDAVVDRLRVVTSWKDGPDLRGWGFVTSAAMRALPEWRTVKR